MKLIFLDRDGVINKYPGDKDYVKSWKEFYFLSGVKPSLKRLNDNGYKLFIISNQAGVAKGLYSRQDLDLITANMLKDLTASGIEIAGIQYCTHRDEDNCNCRKPRTGMVETVIAGLKKETKDVDLKNSYFIGDTIRDIETGKACGLKTILVFCGKEKPENKQRWQVLPDFVACDLPEAADIILSNQP